MKRRKAKIGTMTEKAGEVRVTRKKVEKLIAVLLILSVTACQKNAWHGSDGMPGDAFLALTWQESEPTYIDAGTGAIPPVFYWGDYYQIRPGDYNLYYEGSVWAGMSWANYAWEVFYEIWEVPGEKGDWYYNGANGPDNYFTIECNPFGPYIGSTYKSGELAEGYELIEESDSTITIKVQKEGQEMIVTYKRVEKKQQSDLLTTK